MRKMFASLLLLGPLLAACGKIEEPIVPELKGKWGAPGIMKAIDQKRQARVEPASVKAVTPTTHEEMCRVSHVTFGKSAIRVNALGFGFSLFEVTGVKREGSRIILSGTVDKKDPASSGKIELMVRNGEVRFDDIYDASGRSIKYERVPEGERVRSYGATTVGEAMGLFLNVKPCPA
jgi:hypothetical protein